MTQSAPTNNVSKCVWESVAMKMIVAFFADESGATAVEYALIAAVIGLGVVVGLGAIRDGLNDHFNNVADGLAE
jgi:pilus assembly protein Flp/PilA